MELLGMDFIRPFSKIDGVKERWILLAVDYFSRFVWAKATQKNDSDTIINFMKTEIFDRFGTPVGMYVDLGPHFGNKTCRFAQSCGVVWSNSPVAAKKAVGMVEKSVDILQRVLKKISPDLNSWAKNVPVATIEVNGREIPHLLYSPAQILFGFNPIGSMEVKFPVEFRRHLSEKLIVNDMDIFPDENEHAINVIHHVLNHAEIKSVALQQSNQYRDKAAIKHDKGICRELTYSPGELVMFYDHREAGKKLRPSWRGPFVITGLGGEMGISYTLRQIDGTKTPRHYYGDALKNFRLREGYLITGKEEALPIYQNIRPGRANFKLPRDLQSNMKTRNQ
ncbi:hypothetical protein K3495_g10592 [Podosphaera aphanis]|nr:hypothetical protein K3495_g10592 [Podosphaera aphanis]